MVYNNIKSGRFISRPNRFIANIEIDGEVCVCHVKNTGRCAELLLPGTHVFVQHCDSPNRKTKYDLIAVYKGERLINIDSQAPNKVFGEWIESYFKNVTYVKPEAKYGNSRFDFYIEADGRKIFAEVKGVTLENDGEVKFPDAPTVRGVKHLNELSDCISEGFEAYVFFIVQMKSVKYFSPNRETHPEFATALEKALENGVNVCCVDCNISPDSLTVGDFVTVKIT